MAIVYVDDLGRIQSVPDGNPLVSNESVGAGNWAAVPDATWKTLRTNNDNKIIDGVLVPHHVPDQTYWLDGEKGTLRFPATLPDGAVLAKPKDIADKERIAEINARLAELDSRSIRPLRAIDAEVATELDRTTLKGYETEAVVLRAELAVLKPAT